MRNPIRVLVAPACVAAALLLLPGCLISGGSTLEQGGMKVTDSTLGQIEIGQTTEAWVIASLGTPSSSTEVSDNPGVKILRYDYTEHHRDRVNVFLLINSRSSKEKVVRTFFEMKDGVVQNYWVERSP